MSETVKKIAGKGGWQAGGTLTGAGLMSLILMLSTKFGGVVWTQEELAIAIPVGGAVLNWVYGLLPTGE